MKDHVFYQHGDEPDAANFSQAFGIATLTNYLVSGFEFDVDLEELTLDVDGGVAAIAREEMETESPVIDPPETRSHVAHPVEAEAVTGIELEEDELHHVYLDANVGTDSSPKIEAVTSEEPPSDESVKIGEVDTAETDEAAAVSEQWFLVTFDGTLTFPDRDAADAAAEDLRDGTLVFERGEGLYLRVRGDEAVDLYVRQGAISRVVDEDETLTIREDESMIVLDWFDAKGDFTVEGDFFIMETE